MALLFVGGIMNLFWIVGLAIYVIVEKTLPNSQIISRVDHRRFVFGSDIACCGLMTLNWVLMVSAEANRLHVRAEIR